MSSQSSLYELAEFCDGEMSPAKTGTLFSPTFRFPDNASSNGGSRPVTPVVLSQLSATANHYTVVGSGEAACGRLTAASDLADTDDEVFITAASPLQVRTGHCFLLRVQVPAVWMWLALQLDNWDIELLVVHAYATPELVNSDTFLCTTNRC